MKVARVVIENFRHIERLELNFTDSLGRVRDVSVIVGPNMSGKTSVLDALAVSIGLSTELTPLRPGFVLNPRIVRKGALHTRVSCWLRFSKEEIEATKQLFQLADEDRPVPNIKEISLTWEYPDPDSKRRSLSGRTTFSPKFAWKLLKGRKYVARLLPTGRADWNWFQKVGGIFLFDQQRTGMGKTIRRDVWAIIHGEEEEASSGPTERYTSDPREILLALAVQSLLPSISGQGIDQFRLIQKRYAEVCKPHQIVGAVRDELGIPDLLFSDGTYEYRYDGLSSGEQMLLLFLIRMVTENIHQSVVLIDEIELHQHPIWQRKLLDILPRIGQNNQIIATTHSPYVRDALPRDAIIELGELNEGSGEVSYA